MKSARSSTAPSAPYGREYITAKPRSSAFCNPIATDPTHTSPVTGSAMLDSNLGDALLRLDLSPRTEAPTAQVERIIDTDRRRVHRWTRIAVALWILAALGALVIFVMGGLAFPAIAK